MVVLEVPVGRPGLFAPPPVNRTLVVAELSQAALRAKNPLHLLGWKCGFLFVLGLDWRRDVGGRRFSSIETSNRKHIIRGWHLGRRWRHDNLNRFGDNAGIALPLEPLGTDAGAALRRPALIVAARDRGEVAHAASALQGITVVNADTVMQGPRIVPWEVARDIRFADGLCLGALLVLRNGSGFGFSPLLMLPRGRGRCAMCGPIMLLGLGHRPCRERRQSGN